MQEPNGLTPAERELEAALKSLAPVAARIDPVAAAFAAGRRTAQRQLRVWQIAASIAFLASAGLWLSWPGTGGGGAPVNFVNINREPAARTTLVLQPVSDQSLLKLREAISSRGIDGLPTTSLPATGNIRSGDFL